MTFLLWFMLALAISASVFSFSLLTLHARAARGRRASGGAASARSALENSILRGLSRMSTWVPRSGRAFSRVRELLMQAGYRQDIHVRIFYGTLALLVLTLPVLTFFLLAGRGHGSVTAFGLTAAAGIAGYLTPYWALRIKKRVRQENVARSLPQALDLMVICVESGIGLDQSIHYLAEELATSAPELCDELGYTRMELQTGLSRVETFRNLARRTDLREMNSLVAALIQTDQVGGSLATTLRVYSDDMRIRWRQEAETRAAKIPIKLVFPIFFFIFPAIFLVTGAPAAIRVARELFRVTHSGP